MAQEEDMKTYQTLKIDWQDKGLSECLAAFACFAMKWNILAMVNIDYMEIRT